MVDYTGDDYLDSPERDILTGKGLRLLLGDLGEKSITKLIQIPGFPYLHISNTYRFHRARVLEWLAGPGEEVLKGLRPTATGQSR